VIRSLDSFLRRLGRTMARSFRVMVSLALAGAASSALAQNPPVVTRAHLEPARGVNFHAVLLPDTIYVGQQATYQIGVFLNQEVRQRLRRNPEFVPPETRSLLVYDLPDAKTPLIREIGGHPYEVHVFQRAFFALSPGRYEVPPSKLTYALPQSASFFSREETHTLRSEALTLTVLPVPTAGRPDDWAGAVGEWRARLRVDSTSGRVGNPLVVTLRIEGRGNVTLLPRPRFNVSWGSAVAADERVEFDSTPSTLRGAKEFDWLVTPRQAGRRNIASQRFAYFNPSAHRFELALSGAVEVSIAPGDTVAVDSVADVFAAAPPAPSGPALTVRPEMGSAAGFSWLRAPWYLAAVVVAPLPALVGAFRRRRRRPQRAPSSAQRLDVAAHAPPSDGAALRRLVHEAMRDRLGIDAGLALANDTLITDLRHEGVTPETSARAAELLRQLDAAVFSGARPPHTPRADELADLMHAVDAEARGTRRASVTRASTVAVLLAIAATSSLEARQESEATKSWAAGQTAFAGRDFARAERHFLDVARLHPDHPNVWVNVGTAAWLADDTARAVQGWQRALRRAPLDAELRDRLALVRAVQDRGMARVPPVPMQLLPFLLLVLWGGGWWVLARRVRAGAPIGRRAMWLVGVSAVIAVAGAALDRTQRARDLAVVTRTEPLRSLPVLGAEPGPAPLTGEVARVLERNGAWVHVELDGGRQGWIAAELMLPLGDD
jgi:hypothetical protein